MALTQSDKKFITESITKAIEANNKTLISSLSEMTDSKILANNKTLILSLSEMTDSKILANNKTLLSGLSDLIDLKVDTRFSELKELIKHLPQRDEWYDKMDQLLGRQKRQEQDIDLVQTRVSDHEDRISVLEAN